MKRHDVKANVLDNTKDQISFLFLTKFFISSNSDESISPRSADSITLLRDLSIPVSLLVFAVKYHRLAFALLLSKLLSKIIREMRLACSLSDNRACRIRRR
jgi:hypothetical protein